MQRQFLYLLCWRLICLDLKWYIFDYKVELSEQEIVFYNLRVAQTNVQAMCSYIPGLHK